MYDMQTSKEIDSERSQEPENVFLDTDLPPANNIYGTCTKFGRW